MTSSILSIFAMENSSPFEYDQRFHRGRISKMSHQKSRVALLKILGILHRSEIFFKFLGYEILRFQAKLVLVRPVLYLVGNYRPIGAVFRRCLARHRRLRIVEFEFRACTRNCKDGKCGRDSGQKPMSNTRGIRQDPRTLGWARYTCVSIPEMLETEYQFVPQNYLFASIFLKVCHSPE